MITVKGNTGFSQVTLKYIDYKYIQVKNIINLEFRCNASSNKIEIQLSQREAPIIIPNSVAFDIHEKYR
jgi:hypothetical protein